MFLLSWSELVWFCSEAEAEDSVGGDTSVRWGSDGRVVVCALGEAAEATSAACGAAAEGGAGSGQLQPGGPQVQKELTLY